jgi:hypothetical protein
MAKTYFEYADRLPESQINWFQVGKDITDGIKKEDELRQKRKAETEAAFRKDVQELANAPTGNSDLVNQYTFSYTSKATDYLLQMNRLLKAGAIKPKDYSLATQNLRDGTGVLFNLVKEYQAEYEEKMKRAQPGGDGSAAETQIMGMVEGFANLRDTEALINPNTGAVGIGKMETKDGIRVLKEGADNYMTVNQLRNRIKQKINKYKVNEDLKGEVELLGDVVNEVVTKTGTIASGGFITKVTDPTKRVGLSQEGKQAVDAYMQSEKDIIAAKLTNPYNTSSILFDWSGGIDPNTKKPYQVVFDEKLAKTSSHYVLYSFKDGVMQPDFDSTENGKEQKKEAERYLTNKFRSMLEQKTEIRTTPQAQLQERRAKTESEMIRKDLETEAENFGRNLALFITGDSAQKDKSGRYFLGQPGITRLKPGASGFTIFEGSKFTDYPLAVDGKVSSAESIGSSMVSILNKSGLPEDVILNAMRRNLRGRRVSAIEMKEISKGKIDFSTEIGEYANIQVPKLVIEDEPISTAKKLTTTFGKLGFTFTPKEGTFGNRYTDRILIKAPNGKSKEFIIDTKDNDLEIANFIRDNRDDMLVEKSKILENKPQPIPEPVPTPEGGAPR